MDWFGRIKMYYCLMLMADGMSKNNAFGLARIWALEDCETALGLCFFDPIRMGM